MSFTARKWRRSTQSSKDEKQSPMRSNKKIHNASTNNVIQSKWSKKRSDDKKRRSAAFDSNRKNTSRDTELQKKTNMHKNTTEEPKFVSKFIRKREKVNKIDDVPMKARTWKNKTSRQSSHETDNNHRSFANEDNNEPIKSKWFKARVKRDSDDGPFSRSSQQKEEYSREPVKKSFNKKIIITERQTLQQRKAAEKAVYDSFIKDSYVLKIEHGDKKTNDELKVTTDCWDSLEDIYGPDPKPLPRTEYDDWYDKFRLEIEGPSKPEPKVKIVYPWEGEYISEHNRNWYIYRQLNASSMVAPEKVQVAVNFYKVSKLDLSNGLKILNISQKSLDELMDPNTPVYKCDIGKMRMNDFLFDYDILNLLKYDDKELRKEFMKLRKKHNANQRIRLKIDKNVKVHQNEMDKYIDRYRVEFLMERLMYFDKYFMDGKLNFINNYTPKL